MSTGMEIVLPSVRQHEAILGPRVGELDKWSGGGEASGEALVRYTMAELSVNDDLRSCTPTSLYLALLSCAVTRLVPGKLKGYSFLVPFGNTKKDPNGNEIRVQEATFMMGWKGVKHIGTRADLHLISAVIHENDIFDYDVGTARFVKYRPAFKAPGPVIGTAAWVELPRGRLEVEYLTLDTLNKIKEAANARRKSPAWNGPFVDQMQRKSALKRLGKQIDAMGEEFLKADAIEVAQDEDGHPGRALDELTDGAASKFLGAQSSEAAAFGHLPRPTQVQVPANDTKPADKPAAEGKLATATDKARAADKKRSERPTTPAGSGSSTTPSSTPAQSSAAKPSSSGSGASSNAGDAAANPTSPTPAASSAGSASAPASAATPAASSPPVSNTEQSQSTDSGFPSTSTDGPGAGADDAGDVASEPADGDTSFDTSFFGSEASDDPVDREPQTLEEWATAFRSFAANHKTKADAIAAWPEFQRIYHGWLAACVSKAQMEGDKKLITDWSMQLFTRGRKPDPAKKDKGQPADPQIIEMQDLFSRRHKELP